MFIGHFAVGFGSKRFAPSTSLATLIAAPIFLDLLWPFFVLAGIEQVRIDPGNTKLTPLDFVAYPYSHSLLMSLVWATLFAGIYFGSTRYRSGAIVVWFGVVSHWILDVLVHRPDMPLYPGGTKVGLSLWNVPAVEIPLEVLMFAGGVGMYLGVTKAKDRIGRWACWTYVVILFGFYVANLLLPPPTAVTPIVVSAIVFTAVLLVWTWWFDKHRQNL